jgi:hypothetical protein
MEVTNITNRNLNTYIKLEQPNKKHFVVSDKQNPQGKLPVLNWNNQNTKITTVEMLTVLL